MIVLRLSSLKINEFRNLRNVELVIPTDTTLVCIVGENGSGKTNLLEALGAVALHFGFAKSIDFVRGFPHAEPHDIEATMVVDHGLHAGMGEAELSTDLYRRWNGTLTVRSRQNQAELSAGGDLSTSESVAYAHRVVTWLRNHSSPSFYWIDADRSYPPGQINDMMLGQALSGNTQPQDLRLLAAQRSTTKYQSWLQFLVTTFASTAVAQFTQAISSAAGTVIGKNPLGEYASLVKSVLPHLGFKSVDIKARTAVFSNGLSDLRFDQLSGGEKELAFLIGQFDRYRLQSGLTVIDEPELHLNPDLVRRWVAFLKGMTTTGQAWIATHSLEAIEAAGFDSTFILQKDTTSALSTSVRAISSLPAQRMLTGLLGFPAFSMAQRLFVLIEGERAGRERQRFEGLFDTPQYAFAPVGGGAEVKRLVGAMQGIADDQGYDFRVHGIIDDDERPDAELARYRSDPAFTVLSVFEVENLYLQPEMIDVILRDLGTLSASGENLIREAGDFFAGQWILERSLLRVDWRPSELKDLKKALMQIRWSQIDADDGFFAKQQIDAIVSDSIQRGNLRDAYDDSIVAYRTARDGDSLWKRVAGKEAIVFISKRAGFNRVDAYEKMVINIWKSGRVARPEALDELERRLSEHLFAYPSRT